MSNFLNRGFILSLDYLSDNNSVNAYIVNKFVLSLNGLLDIVVAVKINSYNLILDIKHSTNIPVIGYINRIYPNSFVNITPTINEIHELAKAGAEIIYLDASMKIRPNNQIIHEFYYKIKSVFPELRFIGEVSSLEDIKNIRDLNFDAISIKGDFDLINFEELKSLDIPLIFNYTYKKVLDCNNIFNMGFNNVIISSKFCTPQYKINEFIQNIF